MFLDLFDSVGTMVACLYEAGMVDEDGNVQKLDVMLNTDAASTIFEALAGTSTTTAYVESASGIGQGGRSGLVAFIRSEEHTSELQSRGHLVCSLMLDKT